MGILPSSKEKLSCQFPLYRRLGKVLPLLVIGAILLSSCCPSGMSCGTVAAHTMTVTPIVAPHQPYRVMRACLDITGSYPKPYLDGAKKVLADGIDKVVMPNSDGLDAYVGWIARNSWNSDALIIHVPSVPADPVLVVSSSNAGIYADAAKKDQTEKENQNQLQANHQYWRSIQAQVRSEANQLRALAPRVNSDGSTASPYGTSVYGCIGRASWQLEATKGQRYLYIASDLEENQYTEIPPHLSFTGVKVRVIFYYCSSASLCEQKTNSWRQQFAKFGVTDVKFFDYQQSTLIQDLFL